MYHAIIIYMIIARLKSKSKRVHLDALLWTAVIAKFTIWVDVDMVLYVVLLKCCTTMGCWYDIESTTESSNKWSPLQGRLTTIVNVVICVALFAFKKMLEHKTDLWFHVPFSVQRKAFYQFLP